MLFRSFIGGGQAFAGESIWTPADGLPLVLEDDEGIVALLENASPGGGNFNLFVGFPFFRYGI